MKFPRNVRIFRGQLDASPFVCVLFIVVLFVLLVVAVAVLHHNSYDAQERIMAEMAAQAHLPIAGGIAVAFWCPYEGLIREEAVIDMVGRFRNAGIKRQYLAGSIGMDFAAKQLRNCVDSLGVNHDIDDSRYRRRCVPVVGR